MQRQASALVISTVVHAVVLGMMALYRFGVPFEAPWNAIETAIVEDREQADFTQDLSLETSVSEETTFQPGAVAAASLGSMSGQPISRSEVERSEALRDPQMLPSAIADLATPGVEQLRIDLGEGQVAGETGARVDGYGAAMSRLTQELLRMMRQQPVVVVWMFDASQSLEDDREEISKNFNKIYDELKIAQDQMASRSVRYSPLETVVCSFGRDLKKLTPQPTGAVADVRAAIKKIENDPSGIEATFNSLARVLGEFGPLTSRSQRKLAIVVVTDESGDDDNALDDVIAQAKKFKAPVYFLGREAVFGYPYAYERWVDPQPPNLSHWVRIDRGPETALPECLQYDGFEGRQDSASSGFGPYGQVRLAKESGGIFFLLSGEESRLTGRDAAGPRKFSDLALKEYEPDLVSRREYERLRGKSEFRMALWQVIVALNPHLDEELVLRRRHFDPDPREFQRQGREQFGRTLRALARLNEGIQQLEKVRPLREKEREPRWRAAYDLAYAQLLSYRVRQFQYLLLLDQHAKQQPKFTDKQSNEWWVSNSAKLLEPDEEQIARTKVDVAELESQKNRARQMFDFVRKEHPGTPWARRAEQEKGWGFGLSMGEVFWHPQYRDPAAQARVPKF